VIAANAELVAIDEIPRTVYQKISRVALRQREKT